MLVDKKKLHINGCQIKKDVLNGLGIYELQISQEKHILNFQGPLIIFFLLLFFRLQRLSRDLTEKSTKDGTMGIGRT